MEHDQTAWQAWLIAIPTVLTALAHWYTNRKTTKTIAKSDEKTSIAVTTATAETSAEISALDSRIFLLETMINKRLSTLENASKAYSENYLNLSAKYTDSVNQLQKEVMMARAALQKVYQQNQAVQPAQVKEGTGVDKNAKPADNVVKTETINDPKDENFGKVVWKKD